MDRKTIIILGVSFLLMLAWVPLVNKLFPPKPIPGWTNRVATATNQLPVGTNVTTPPVPTTPAVAPTNQAPLAAEATAPTPPSGPEELMVVTNASARYTFTSHGGGLKLVELVNYPAEIKCNQKPTPNNTVTLNTAAWLPVLAIAAGPDFSGVGTYQLKRTEDGVQSERVLTNGLRVVKRYQLSSNYLVNASVRIENTSSNAVALPAQEVVLGTVSSQGAHDDPTRIGVYWYNGNKKDQVSQAWFANKTLGCFPGTPRTEYRAGTSNVVWGAVHSQFFTLAVVPNHPAPEIRVVEHPSPSTTPVREKIQPVAFQASFLYPGLTVEPRSAIDRDYHIYAGPKEYKRLVRLGSLFKNELHLIMDYDGFFGWFAQLLLSSMNGLNGLGLNYAFAIIVITVIIKLLFWPLTNASTRSMKRMSALQPQMKAIQEKYKDDPKKMNTKLMEFMKENKVSPLGGCLPMLLQIPVFFGFFKMIQSAIELRGAQFLWACDLSRPDTIFTLPGLNFPVNPLPLLMGATMLWQARLTPPSPGMDPMQQKIMKYMPVMFLFILYNFSAGLTLYWTVQNLLTIAQMKLTKTKDAPAGPAARPAGPSPGPRKKK